MDTLLEIIQSFRSSLEVGQLHQLGAWNYILLAVLVAVEGPIVTLLGAAAASAGSLRPGLVFLAASMGNLTADILWYSLGYLGKTDWLKRHGRWFSIKPEHVTSLEHEMHTHIVKILVIAKLTLSLSLPALVAAGMARVPWRRWFFAVFAAEGVWTGSLVLGGYYLSEFIKQLELGLQIIAITVIILFFVVLGRSIKRIGLHLNGPLSTNQTSEDLSESIKG
jgi:membrane protein DedA with SNARE-associated domain